MQIPGSYPQRSNSVCLRYSPGICMLTPHPHPQMALAQCTLAHTLRNSAQTPPEQELKATVRKGKLITPVSVL